MSWLDAWMAAGVEGTSAGMLSPTEQEFHGCHRGDLGCAGALLRLHELHRDVPEVLSHTRLASSSAQGPQPAPCSLTPQPGAAGLPWAVLQARAGQVSSVSQGRGVSTSPALKQAASSFKKPF